MHKSNRDTSHSRTLYNNDNRSCNNRVNKNNRIGSNIFVLFLLILINLHPADTNRLHPLIRMKKPRQQQPLLPPPPQRLKPSNGTATEAFLSCVVPAQPTSRLARYFLNPNC